MRAHFQRRIARLWDFRKTNLPAVEAGRLFYRMNTGMQQQSPLYMREGLDGPATLLIDPNILWPDATTSLAEFSPSPDAPAARLHDRRGGADWQTVHACEPLSTGQDLPDEVHWVRFSTCRGRRTRRASSTRGIPSRRAARRLRGTRGARALLPRRRHAADAGPPGVRISRAPAMVRDRRPHRRRPLPARLDLEGADNTNRLYVADLRDPRKPDLAAKVRPLTTDDGVEFLVLGNDGPGCSCAATSTRPNRKVIALDLRRPEPILLEDDRAGIETRDRKRFAAGRTAGRRVPRRRQAARDVRSRRQATGRDVPLPGTGSLSGFTGREDSPLIFYAFTSPLYPTTVFAHDLSSGRSTPFEAGRAPIDAARYEDCSCLRPRRTARACPSS